MAVRFINEETGNIKTAVFCFTGKSPKTRIEMEAIANQAGASVTKSITNKTTILVIADATSMSSKAQKARIAGIDLISPTQFFAMCNEVTAKELIEHGIKFNKKLNILKNKTKQNISKSRQNEKMRHSLVRRVQL